MDKEIKFKDLNLWLKIAVAWGIVSLIFFVIAFLIEFIFAIAG